MVVNNNLNRGFVKVFPGVSKPVMVCTVKAEKYIVVLRFSAVMKDILRVLHKCIGTGISIFQIDGGSVTVAAAEGIEATWVQINGGDVSVTATDDGVNAAHKSSAYTPTVEINGGSLTIVMGAGDTDGVDSNGNIIINGGTISVTGGSSFDCDGTAQYNGGTIIVNGQQVNSIPNQMMGGMRGGFGGGSRGGGGWH